MKTYWLGAAAVAALLAAAPGGDRERAARQTHKAKAPAPKPPGKARRRAGRPSARPLQGRPDGDVGV